MLISTLDDVELAAEYPELVGKRVAITGVDGPLGIDVVRAFAEARTRLVVQALEDGPETLAMAEIIAPYAMDVKLYPGALEGTDAMLRFARDAARKYGGLDAVVNLTRSPSAVPGLDEAEIEGLVADALAMPVLATRVAINRMRTMVSPGSIVNIVVGSSGMDRSGEALAAIARHALASFTRAEAAAAAPDAIRVNAIVPAAHDRRAGSALSGTGDVASLALHLASGRSPDLTGLVFEAWCG